LLGLGFGVGGSYENDRASTATTQLTGGYTTDGQQKFFAYTPASYASGDHWRVSPQAYYYYGPFSLLGEYAISDQKVVGGTVTAKKPVALQNTAWEITTGWVLTGEDAGYNGVTPLHPFNLHSGGWGAWQIVARYADLTVDDNAFTDGFAAAGSAGEAKAVSIGLNWYLNRNIRLNASFAHTAFDDVHGTATAVTKQAENVLFTRIQLAF
jgi:phosphate-selective porin OprO/OprP